MQVQLVYIGGNEINDRKYHIATKYMRNPVQHVPSGKLVQLCLNVYFIMYVYVIGK